MDSRGRLSLHDLGWRYFSTSGDAIFLQGPGQAAFYWWDVSMWR